MGEKSVAAAYFLWLTLGLFGVHHLYLRREKQAFIWAITLGGFGFGWLRDAYRIPEYVKAANNEQAWSGRLAARMKRESVPQTYFVVGMTQYATGAYLATCAAASVFFVECALYAVGFGYRTTTVQRMGDDGMESVPEEVLIPAAAFVMRVLRHFFSCGGMALGVYLAGTVNDYVNCDIRKIFYYVTAAKSAAAILAPDYDSAFVVGSAGLWAYRNTLSWNQARSAPRGACRRWSYVTGAALLVGVLLCVHVYTTVEFESNGETIKLTDAFRNFKHSRAYTEMWAVAGQFFAEMWRNGFWETFKQMKSAADIDGTDHAYDVLGLERDSPLTTSELKRVRNALALEHHPDKQQTAEGRAAAEIKFREIQDAYKTLLKYAVKSGGGGSASKSSASDDTPPPKPKRSSPAPSPPPPPPPPPPRAKPAPKPAAKPAAKPAPEPTPPPPKTKPARKEAAKPKPKPAPAAEPTLEDAAAAAFGGKPIGGDEPAAAKRKPSAREAAEQAKAAAANIHRNQKSAKSKAGKT